MADAKSARRDATSDPRYGRDLRVAAADEILAGARRLTETALEAPVSTAAHQFALRCIYAIDCEIVRREQVFPT